MALKLSRDVKLRLFGPICLFLFGAFFFRLRVYVSASWDRIVLLTMVGVSCGYIGWTIGRWVVLRLQHYCPGLSNTRRRLFILAFLMLVLANFNGLLRNVVNELLHVGIYHDDLFDYIETVGIQLVYVITYAGIYEGTYLVRQWQQTYVEKENLTKAQWQARLDVLKSQVNPHFLFNSLNALSALIDESPYQAGQFVDELSKVYRYMLQTNDHELATVASELRFIQSYAHLLKTRHGSGINIQINVPEAYHAYSLPPLSLQLLLENAVKHNVVQPSRPLTVEISTTINGQLMVRNKLQPKQLRVLSTGIGLSNISAKYQLLAQTDIGIRDDDGYFTVLLPLLSAN